MTSRRPSTVKGRFSPASATTMVLRGSTSKVAASTLLQLKAGRNQDPKNDDDKTSTENLKKSTSSTRIRIKNPNATSKNGKSL